MDNLVNPHAETSVTPSPIVNKESLLNLTLYEKIQYTDKIRIKTSRIKSIIKKISECHKSLNYLTKPLCMSIFGETGVGKSEFSKFFSKMYPDKIYPEITHKTVLSCNIPCPAYIGSLPSSMLSKLGDPLYSKGRNIFEKTQRLYDLIRISKVEIIFLDEVQHLVDRNRQTLIRDSSDWFKELIDEVRVPVIFSGITDSKRIFLENEQLGSRVRYREDLLPFNYDLEFRQFLHVYDTQLPFKNLSNLGSQELSKRIYIATRGIMRNIHDLIIEATKISLNLNLNQIPLSVLAEAFDNILLNSGENTFKT